MNSFEDLENIWGSQKENSPKQPALELIEKANTDSEQVKRKFLSTMLILGITCLVLLGYMLVYKTYAIRILFICNNLMVLLLVVRIALEWDSYRTLNKVSFTATTRKLVSQTEKFYAKRKLVNFILSPLIFLTYWGVFYFLEPSFKVTLSNGMYKYIMVSGFILFIGLAFIIFRSIRREMTVLNKMRNYLGAMEN